MLSMAWGSRHTHQFNRQTQDPPTMVHSDRVLGFFPAYPTPTLPSGPAAHVHHHPYPYDMVSPASLTHDFDQSPSSYYGRESPPHFTRPLSMSVLDDPAFSSDPRVHPHFPLTNASFCKELPSKSPVMIVDHLSHTPPDTPSDPSTHHQLFPLEDPVFVSHSPESEDDPSSATTSTCVSLDSDSHTALSAFTSPTVSSATSHLHSPAYPKIPRIPPPVSFPLTTSSVSALPCHDPRSSPSMSLPASDRPIPKRHASAPEKHVKPVKPPAVRFETAPVHADNSNRPEGKRRMKNFMRRLTSSRGLDRIDETSEADPFEAVGSNLARLGPAHMYNDVDVLRGDFYSKSMRESIPRPLRTQKSARVPRTGAHGPSQSVMPGEIFHYSPGDIIVSPSHIPPHHPINPPEGVPPSYTSLHAHAGHSSPPSPRIHRFGDDIPAYLKPARDELAPYPQSMPVLPPGRNEQYLETSSSSRGDTNQGTLSSLPIVEPSNLPGHRSTRSLDSSRTHTSRSTQSTSGFQNSLQPPRHHHLPKRLVMPAPLQQQQQQPLFPRAYSYNHDTDLDLFPSPDCNTHDPPAMYSQGRKLLRKKTAVFPGNVPLPTHAPVVHADAIAPVTKHPSVSFSDVRNVDFVKEGVRRRKLSKRK